MIWLKLIRKFIKVLNSNASPTQIAMGIAFGSLIGFLPFFSLLSLCVFFLILMLNVNISAAFLSIALFSIVSFPLDPIAHKIGYQLLAKTDALIPLWTSLYNMPLVPFTRFNNSIVLGSLVIGIVLFIPVFIIFKRFVIKYRTSWQGRLDKIKIFKMLGISKLYSWYQKFIAE